MQSSRKNDVLLSLALLATGIMFLAFRGEFIGIVMTVIGASLIVFGIINIFYGDLYQAIAEAVVGAFIIVFGWLLVSVAFYVIAVALIFYGIVKIRLAFTLISAKATLFLITVPFVCGILNIVLGFLLFFNQGGTIDWIFIVSGIGLIIEGILGLVDVIIKKPVIKKRDKGSVKTEDGSEFHY